MNENESRVQVRYLVWLFRIAVASVCLIILLSITGTLDLIHHWWDQNVNREHWLDRCCKGEQRGALSNIVRLLKTEGSDSSLKCKPFDLFLFESLPAECPFVAEWSKGHQTVPYLAVYSIRRRTSGLWVRPGIVSDPPVPIVIDIPHSEMDGSIQDATLFSDRRFYDTSLPIWHLPMSLCREDCTDSITAVEIEIPKDAPGFPYGKEISGLRAQFLSIPPIQINVGGVSWPQK